MWKCVVLASQARGRARRAVWQNGHWRLYQGGNSFDWNNEGKRQSAVAADGLQHAADLLASRFAPLGGGSTVAGIKLKVAGVESLADYAEVDRLLQSQSSLERAQLIAVEADALVYRLQLRGGLGALEQGLKLGGVIEPDLGFGSGQETPDDDIDLRFRKRR